MDLETMRARLEERCMAEPMSGCWLWTAGRNSTGYGIIAHNVVTHRASWMVFRGPIPNGLRVLHRCDNRSCINPDHLFLGTQRDNVHDMMRKQRHPYIGRPLCPHGHDWNNENGGDARCVNCRERMRARALGPRKPPSATRTQCPRGHAYTADNTSIIDRGGKRVRRCRACRNTQDRARRASGCA